MLVSTSIKKGVSTHIEDECPLTIISCPYAEIGCEAKVQRQERECHLQSATRVHLDLVYGKLSNTETKLSKTEDELNNTQDKLKKTEERLKTKEDKIKKTEDELKSTQALLNATRVDFKKEMELLQLSNVIHTNLFLWRIDGFREILRQAKCEGKERIDSDPFYTKTETESYGYKLKVILYPNGDSAWSNNHLSTYLVVMKGKYDAILPWPFKNKVRFTLIDQQQNLDQRENVANVFVTQNLSNFVRPVKEENAGRGWRTFISHEKLYSRRFIVDDTLFLQVEISSPPS